MKPSKKECKKIIVECLPTIPEFMINYMINYEYKTQTQQEKIKLLESFKSSLNGHVESLKKKDMPLKPRVPYVIFWKENYNRIKTELNNSDINAIRTECASQWKSLSEDKQRYYFNLYEEDKQRYQQEIQVYNSKK